MAEFSAHPSRMLSACYENTQLCHLPPKRHVDQARQPDDQQKQLPTPREESTQRQQHVAQVKKEIDAQCGKCFPGPWT